MVNNIKQCYVKRTNIKGTEDSLSIEYRNQLVAVKETADEIKAAIYIRNSNKIERQHKVFRNIRQMEKKIKGWSTNKVTVIQKNGAVIEYNEKDDTESVIARSNEIQ